MIIETAEQAARAAGDIVRRHFMQVPDAEVREKSKNDLISFVDEQSEQTIVRMIHDDFPDHTILAEEGGKRERESDYQWIVDPLDGTKNYITGIPVFAVSIAVKHEDEIVAGVIYDPLRDELFRAEKAKGAFLNDRPINVSQTRRLSEGFLATGFPFKAKHKLQAYVSAFHDIFTTAVGMRRLGAAAIDLAYVACGRFDGFWELGLSPWDVAAGAIIVREAGGMISDFWNQNNFLYNKYLLATNGNIHFELSQKIQNHFPEFKPVDNK